jgi:7-cyano-7-deazaguanine synthase
MSRALVLLSGGIDSAVSLAWASKNFTEIAAISFQYYLRPFREQLAVYRLLQHYPARLFEIPLPFIREAADLPQKFSSEVPEGYISNRNMIFYSIACYYAEVNQCDSIVGGHIHSDQESFQDASGRFFERLQSLCNEAILSREIKIELPLAKLNKDEVLQMASKLNVPLQYTWSCYWDGTSPCGQCVSCVERKEAFEQAGLTDPCTT